jgi:putative ABC transport system ATP-binding protein
VSLIKFKRVSKIYHKIAIKSAVLSNIDLTIESGDFVTIMGPSGSGKSTLLNIIGFLDSQSGGNYYFEGIETKEYDDVSLAKIRNHRIGFVFQSFNLIPELNVEENIALPLIYSNKHSKNKEVNFKVRALLEQLGMPEKIHYFPNQLSGGQKQRVAIARSMINDQDVILADEPTGNLDSATAQQILDLFFKLNTKGKTIVLVTHDQSISRYASKIIRIENGSICSK